MACLLALATQVARIEGIGPEVVPPRARLLVVRTMTIDSRIALRVLATEPLEGASVRREGPDVVVSFVADVADDFPEPEAPAPLQKIVVLGRPAGASVFVRVPPEVPFEVRREAAVLTVLFGEEAGATVEPPTALYPLLFPGAAETPPPEPETEPAKAEESSPDGVNLGPLNLRPTAQFGYADADVNVLDTPRPVRDRYFVAEPRVELILPVSHGRLRGSYGPRIRFHSSIDEVNGVSHFFDGSLELPVGTRTIVRVKDHYAVGVLETNEVDPGREYFFDLARFRRNDVDVGADVTLGTRLGLVFGAGRNSVHFLDPGGFFDYEEQSARAGLSVEVREGLMATASYGYGRLPRPEERPQAASTAHSVGVDFKGSFAALTSGQLGFAYRRQSNPEAGEGGRLYSGLTAFGSITRELGPATSVMLGINRAVEPSAFEDNGFYVTTGLQGEARFQAPFEIAVHAGTAYQWNTYRTLTAELGEPREDTLFGWSLGAGRPLGRRTFLRADFRRERRRSNIEAFRQTNDTLLIQLGVGFFGVAPR
jgi:Putative beta-barrel porin 2